MTLTQTTRDQDEDETQELFVPGEPFAGGQDRNDAQRTDAASNPLPADHPRPDSQIVSVGGIRTSLEPSIPALSITAAAQENTLSVSHTTLGTHGPTADGASSHPESKRNSEPNSYSTQGAFLYNGYLSLLSDSLDDIEGLRIATDNRIRSLTRTETDSDGEMRGLGLDARSPQVARAMAMAESIHALEHQAALDLQREIRQHPLYGWVKRSKGIGEKQGARLIAVIGDPYWNDLHDRPRTVSELWAYCGYSVNAGHAQRRARGVVSNWSSVAKSRAYLMAESCIKQLTGDYRKVYDAARIQYTEAVHPHECVRCGPAGKPAQAGSPLSLGHQHARALRLVAKEILKDLWLEARDIHQQHHVIS